MPLQHNAQPAYNKGKLYLAIKAIQATLPNSTRHASKLFNVPYVTTQASREGIRNQCESATRHMGVLGR
jgi:hypothetical protein